MRKQFKYDRVFASGSTQEEVYEDTKALIRSVLDGERCSPAVLSYAWGHHCSECRAELLCPTRHMRC